MSRRLLLSHLALVVAGCGVAPAPPPLVTPAEAPLDGPVPVDAVPAWTLSDDVIPEAYRLRVEADPDRVDFRGELEVDVTLARATDLIFLHAKQLDIREVDARVGGATVRGRWHLPRPIEGLGAVRLARSIGPGRATLRFRYDGQLENRDRSSRRGTRRDGFYRGFHGATPYLVTQLEPLGARLAFPCFDEPRFRATFELELIAPATLVAASNTRVAARDELEDGRSRWRFERTSPLPSYVVGWVVGPFDVVELPPLPPSAVRPRPLPLRGLGPASEHARTRWLIERTAEIIVAAEARLGVPFPYEALDVVLVPEHPFLAMENAGLITLEAGGPMAPGLGPDVLPGYAVDVLAHEVAHQWFGDLVSIVGWEEHWLKEALAQWVAVRVVPEPLAPARIAPPPAVPTPILTEVRSEDDARHVFEVHSPVAQLRLIAVLDALERWLGSLAMTEALRGFVTRHAGRSASHRELADELDRVHEGAGDALRRYVTQPGLPIVMAHLVCDGDRRGLELSQAGETSWLVPMCVRYPVGQELRERCVLAGEREFLSFEARDCPRWVRLGADGRGAYGVAPPEEDLDLLARGLSGATEGEQGWLAAAIENGVDTGSLPLARALPLLGPLARSRSDGAQATVLRLVSRIRNDLVTDAERPAVDRWARDVVRPIYTRWAWDVGPASPALGLDVLALLALDLRDPRVRAECLRRVRAAEPSDPNVTRVHDPMRIALAVALQEDPTRLDADPIWIERGGSSAATGLFALSFAGEGAMARGLGRLATMDRPELGYALRRLLTTAETRDAAWRWVRGHPTLVPARAPQRPWEAESPLSDARALAPICDPAALDEVLPEPRERFATALAEAARCAWMREHHGEGVRRVFAAPPGRLE